MDTIMRNLAAEYPDADKDAGASAVLYRDDLTGNLEPILLALGAAVGFSAADRLHQRGESGAGALGRPFAGVRGAHARSARGRED